MANTVNIRTTKEAEIEAEFKLGQINELRFHKGKVLLSKSKLIALAIKKLTINHGVKS